MTSTIQVSTSAAVSRASPLKIEAWAVWGCNSSNSARPGSQRTGETDLPDNRGDDEEFMRDSPAQRQWPGECTQSSDSRSFRVLAFRTIIGENPHPPPADAGVKRAHCGQQPTEHEPPAGQGPKHCSTHFAASASSRIPPWVRS